MEDKGYLHPDPATRRRVMVVAVLSGICVLAIGVLLLSVVRPWLDRYFLALEELARHNPVAANRSLLNVMALMVALNTSVAIGFGIWIFYLGWRMMKAEQWPRPGMNVYARVKILDARSARRRGKVLIVLGLILATLVPALGWKAYRDISAFLAAPRSNNRLQPTAPGAAAEPSPLRPQRKEASVPLI
jgi:hypothetical protein